MQNNSRQQHWQFWVDRGGTFTDIIARAPDGALHVHKLLSDNPKHYPDATLAGIDALLQQHQASRAEISEVRMGTTVGTNALLERRGEPVALAITEGFRDALQIAYQHRPDIFALEIKLPKPLYQDIIELPERYHANGEVLKPLNAKLTRERLQALYDGGCRNLAIVCVHADRYPKHEQQVAEIAAEIGFQYLSLSHQISPLIKLVSRGHTTVVDAYLTPVLKRHTEHLQQALEHSRLFFMQSNGGLAEAGHFRGRDCILSGPAGGIVGATRVAEQLGYRKVIGFDMGGTSTDVSHYAGELERCFDTQVAGVPLRVPLLNIHTVAAGGGSKLHFDGQRFQVGPDSAGANPGPACYRNGGALTVTDCNVMLGRIQPDYFPAVFGADGKQCLDSHTVAQQFKHLAETIREQSTQAYDAEKTAQGFLNIAVDNMANAIKKVSLEQGYDVQDYLLCCFGGAGGQHACLVADALGMQKILIHPLAGVLSAYGMGLAQLRSVLERTIEQPLSPKLMPTLEKQLAVLKQQAEQDLCAQGAGKTEIRYQAQLQLRYQGTDASLSVSYADLASLEQQFSREHHRRYGFSREHSRLDVAALLLEAFTEPQSPQIKTAEASDSAPSALAEVPVYWDAWQQTPVYQRDDLPQGSQIQGPALIMESTGTTVLEPQWQAEVLAQGELLLSRCQSASLNQAQTQSQQADPVQLEIFSNVFMNIAEQMGVTLANTAYSVNIKERLDFSCAIFDHAGELVANAPHVPVHLGSMSDSVKALMQSGLAMQAGDSFYINNPYQGGTHLPDITVVTPVFVAEQDTPAFYLAARGHHADIGGSTPGSMPADSTHIQAEGVLIDVSPLVRAGDFLSTEVSKQLQSGAYPVRNLAQNLADLHAQVAANNQGVQALLQLVGQHGLETVSNYMGWVQDHAEAKIKQRLKTLHAGQFRYPMDNGCEINVTVRISPDKQSADIDFTGTSPQHEGNFNAPLSVCRAAVLYVFRTLVRQAIPLNAGCLRPLHIKVPKGCLLNPTYPAAVVAGNVETSQYVVDALYGALGIMAASQGTMNNLTFGNSQYQYYETLCGGSGAGPDFHGTDAVHTHMTNSRLTDVEILEQRFPVRLLDFHIRADSGGGGRYDGGHGVVRRLYFEEPMQAAILSGHRKVKPYGLAGGLAGAKGRNRLYRQGESITLASTSVIDIEAGDELEITTPGGGGYGYDN